MTAPSTLSRDAVTEIAAAANAAEAALRARHPWLRHQDAIGLSLLVLSLAGMLACAVAFARGVLPAWLCIPMVALFASITHELEHDLIHWMYFRRRPAIHHVMMALVWLARPSTINPWLRRGLHFHHHKHSGTEIDIEERAITNGERWSLTRLLMTADAPISILVRAWRAPDAARRWRVIWRSAAAYFPLGWCHWGLWWTFLIVHLGTMIGAALGHAPAWPSTIVHAMPVVDLLIVTWIAPNVLRSFCLHFISSNMHYYGDIEADNVAQQTQVFTSPWLWPFQLFCFNFGGTHAIHHVVVRQPFYIRQWIAGRVLPVMRRVGVRFDDFASMRRANRWHAQAPASP